MSVNLVQLADSGMGLGGKDSGNGDFVFVSIPYTASSPLTMTGAVFNRSMVVHAVTVNPDVASSNAVTATAYQTASATALGSGTAVTGTMALSGVAGTNVSGTVTAANAQVASGSRIGVVISGALGAAGSGVITFACTPA